MVIKSYFYYLIIILRVVFAPLILIWPTTSIIVSFFLDWIDADFAYHVVSKKQYQVIDKLLDDWVYIFEMILAWHIFYYKYIFLALFLWRIIGTIIFYIKGNRKVFLIFANYFENIFFVMYFGLYFNLSNTTITWLIAISCILKIFQEWFIHVADLSVREDFLRIKRKWIKEKN